MILLSWLTKSSALLPSRWINISIAFSVPWGITYLKSSLSLVSNLYPPSALTAKTAPVKSTVFVVETIISCENLTNWYLFSFKIGSPFASVRIVAKKILKSPASLIICVGEISKTSPFPSTLIGSISLPKNSYSFEEVKSPP